MFVRTFDRYTNNVLKDNDRIHIYAFVMRRDNIETTINSKHRLFRRRRTSRALLLQMLRSIGICLEKRI